MRKRIFIYILVGCIFFSYQCSGQLSVFLTTGSDVIGWAAGKSNAGCERDDKARADFYNKGGDNNKGLWVSWSSGGGKCLSEEYGCYALVKGKSSKGETIFGYAGGFKTSEEALDAAKRSAMLQVPGAEENTIQVLTSGCIMAPTTQKQQVKQTPTWTDWKNDNCFSKLKFRVLQKDVYDLNHQYHYYFEFTNNYKETVYFDFNLLDSNRKIRFGDRHKIWPGRTIQFNHKMTYNYIASFSTEKVCFKLDNKNYSPCLSTEEDRKKNTPEKDTAAVKKNNTDKDLSIDKLPNKNISDKVEPVTIFEKSEWKNEEGMTNVKIEMASDGLHWIEGATDHYDIYKKTSATTYQLGGNKDYCIIEFLTNDRIKHFCSSSTYVFYYTRLSAGNGSKTVTSNETKPDSLSAKKTTNLLDIISGIENKSSENVIASPYNGKWESNDMSVILTIGMVDEGMSVKAYYPNDKTSSATVVFKKISSDSYKGEQSGTILKLIDNGILWISGKTSDTFLYHRYTGYSTSNIKPSSIAGVWDGENGVSGTITMAENGFNWVPNGQQGFSSYYKKTAADTYRCDDGSNYCIVKFLSDTKLDYSCNGTHYAYFTRRK